MSFIILHGLPKANLLSGMSFVTTDPAPTVTLLPIFTPGMITTFPPIQTLSPIETGLEAVRYRLPFSSLIK